MGSHDIELPLGSYVSYFVSFPNRATLIEGAASSLLEDPHGHIVGVLYKDKASGTDKVPTNPQDEVREERGGWREEGGERREEGGEGRKWTKTGGE